MLVPSTDGVEVAVHDLGGAGPLVLLSHATGFHGLVWRPVAAHLARSGFHCLALDYRGHGDTAPPPGWTVDWYDYGDDAIAVVEAVAEPGGIIGVGHSMGGAGLLMAALHDPLAFRGLLLYEPIVLPPGGIGSPQPSPLATGARRRRSSFPSYEAAIENFGAKPPLQAFTPEALEAYVRGGFVPGEDGQVHLKCRPEHEALTFEASAGHDTWSRLGEVRCPVWVVAGRRQEGQPSTIAEQIAEQLPEGRYVELPALDHFGPMTDPHTVAGLVVDLAATL